MIFICLLIIWGTFYLYARPHYNGITAINNMDAQDESDFVLMEYRNRVSKLGTEFAVSVQSFDEYRDELEYEEQVHIRKYMRIAIISSVVCIAFNMFISSNWVAELTHNIFNDCTRYF